MVVSWFGCAETALFYHVREAATASDELGEAAALDDPSFVQDQQQVGIRHGR
jgi:hypothetical protein